MEKPLINILIRTHRRPKGLQRLIGTIRKSTYKNIRVLISTDDAETEAYTQAYGECFPVSASSDALESPYNLYLNHLLEQVNDGFVIIIDDDDMVGSRYALSRIAKKAQKGCLLIGRMSWPNGRVIPEDAFMGRLPFVRRHIGMPCMVFDISDLGKTRFDGHKAADFRFANKMAEKLEVIWMDEIFAKIGNTGLGGAAIDIA